MRERLKRFGGEMKYIGYFLAHPFKAFWEIKTENTGSVASATFLFILLLISSTLKGVYSGYIFNPQNGAFFPVLKNLLVYILVFFVYCIANWCLTCLFDGEGTFKDIYKATAYSVIPMIAAYIIVTPLSNVLSLREAAFYAIILNLSYVWVGMLIFISNAVTHNYTFFKTLLMLLCIAVGMAVIFYIGLLFINLLNQMTGFAEAIIKEIVNRN